MEVINETLEIRDNDVLPQILMRIFSVCKADPEFPLKEKMKQIEIEAEALQERLNRQNKMISETVVMRDDLSNRLQNVRQTNFELKAQLLEELGSEI
jgi:hypothetical protein